MSLGTREKPLFCFRKVLRCFVTHYSDFFAMNIPKHRVWVPLKSQIDTECRSCCQFFEKKWCNEEWKVVQQGKNKKNPKARMFLCYNSSGCNRLWVVHTMPAVTHGSVHSERTRGGSALPLDSAVPRGNVKALSVRSSWQSKVCLYVDKCVATEGCR